MKKASFTTTQRGKNKLAPNTRGQIALIISESNQRRKAKIQKIVDSNLVKYGIDDPRLAIDISKDIGEELIIK
jgi:hypothetical protein